MCPPLSPSVQAWRDLCAQYGSDLDSRATDRLLQWIAIESCGNPCSLDATRKAALASGHVPDVGPFQLYFETAQTTIGGYTSAQLRAGCVGTSQSGSVSAATRDLQASVSIQWLRDSIASQNAVLNGLGVSWSERDRWRWYKFSTHGLPAVAVCMLPLVVQQLGRPPADWDEFRSTCETMDRSVIQAAAADPAANDCTACLSVAGLWETAFNNAEEMDLVDESAAGVFGFVGLDMSTGLALLGLGLLYWFFLR